MSETFDLFDPPPDGDATPDATADVPGTAPTAASRVAVPDPDGVPVGACRDTPLRGEPPDAGVAPPRTAASPDAASPDAASPDGDLGVPPFRYAEVPIEPGRTLVEASAGTGKTFAIAGLVIRLVLEGAPLADPTEVRRAPDADAVLPDLRRLLVVTFTRAATEELRGRIRSALRAALRAARGEPVAASDDALIAPFRGGLLDAPPAAARLQAALDRVDEAGVLTIHGFCRRTLDALAFESGTPFGLDVTDDDGPLRRRAAADAWTALVHDRPDLAALAVRLGWTPEALLKTYGLATRYPGTELRPAPVPLADALGALQDARRELGRVWSAEAAADAFEGVVWGKNADQNDPALVARVAAFAERPDDVEAVRLLAPAGVREGALKNSKAKKEAIARAVEHPAVRACGAVVEAVEALRVAVLHRFVADVGAAFDAVKRRRGVLSQDDLLARLHDALDPDAPTAETLARAIKDRTGVVVIDEFQDTDPVQYGIFRRAFGDAAAGGLGEPGTALPVFFVGDPKQAIYAFRGADVHAYLRAQAEAHRRYTLGTNWRSAGRLVASVNRLFGNAHRPFVYDGIPFRPVRAAADPDAPALVGDAEPPFVWWELDGPAPGKPLGKGAAREQLYEATVGEIVRLLDRGLAVGGRPLTPRDLAVLTRTRAQARELQARLAAAGVPAAVSSAGDIREAREMVEVERVLHAAARPHDERAVRAALATEMWGWSAARLAAFEDDPDAGRVRRTLDAAQLDWRRHGALRALAGLFEAENVPGRLLGFRDGERRMTNLRHVLEIVHEAERSAARSPEELLHWLAGRHDHALGGDRTEMRLESDDRAVQLTTLHNAKGLEYEVVFLPFLWDVRPGGEALAHVGGRPVLHLRPDAPDAAEVVDAQRGEALAEALRQAYVALTRARERCYVAWGNVRDAEHSALAYLLLGHGAGAGRTDGAPTDVAREALHRASRTLGSALDAVEALAGPDDGAVVAGVPGPPPPRAPLPTDGPALELQPARRLGPDARSRLADLWRSASFSAWSSGARRADTGDALAAAPADRPSADEPDAGPADDAPAEPDVSSADDAGGLHAFAAGRGPGICLHEILETTDLADPDGERTAERIRLALQRHGLAAPRRHRAPIDPAATVADLLRRVAAVRLGAGGPALAEVARAAGPAPDPSDPPATLLPEWRFVLALNRTAPADLAAAFREHGGAHADYADDLARLSRDDVRGVLTGIVDLVAHHGDRWHVLDWKSNRLGTTTGAYGATALADAMREHHYVLQAHLYLVGLHRFLRSRLGDAYDYDTHVGGAHYVFLRGLDSEPSDGAAQAGVVAERPTQACIHALDAALR